MTTDYKVIDTDDFLGSGPGPADHAQRIDPNDSGLTAAMKLADGNPAALRALSEIMTSTKAHDPGAAAGPVTHLLSLDRLGIYGSGIWMLYDDICGRNAFTLINLLRAQQLGFVSERELWVAATTGYTTLDIPTLLEKVRASTSAPAPVDAPAKRQPKTIEQRMILAIAEQFGMEVGALTRSTNLVEDLHADSLDLVELVMAVEDEFSIEIPDEDAEKLETIGQSIDYVTSRPEVRV